MGFSNQLFNDAAILTADSCFVTILNVDHHKKTLLENKK